jgi:hypothetical protein
MARHCAGRYAAQTGRQRLDRLLSNVMAHFGVVTDSVVSGPIAAAGQRRHASFSLAQELTSVIAHRHLDQFAIAQAGQSAEPVIIGVWSDIVTNYALSMKYS